MKRLLRDLDSSDDDCCAMLFQDDEHEPKERQDDYHKKSMTTFSRSTQIEKKVYTATTSNTTFGFLRHPVEEGVVGDETLTKENELKAQIKEAQESQKQTRSELECSKAQLLSLTKEKADLMQEKLKLQEKVTNLLSEVIKLKEAQNRMEKINSDLTSKVTELQDTNLHKSSEIIALNSELVEMKKDMKHLQFEIDKCKGDTNRSQKKIDDLEKANSALLKEKEEDRIKISNFEEKTSNINDLRMQIKIDKEIQQILEENLKQKDQEISKLTQTRDVLVESVVEDILLKQRNAAETSQGMERTNQSNWNPTDEFPGQDDEEKDTVLSSSEDGSAEVRDDEMTEEHVSDDNFPPSQCNIVYITTVGTQTNPTASDQCCSNENCVSMSKYRALKKKFSKSIKVIKHLKSKNVGSSYCLKKLEKKCEWLTQECCRLGAGESNSKKLEEESATLK